MTSNRTRPKGTEGSVSKNIRALKKGSVRTRAEAISELFPALKEKAHGMAHAKLRGTGADSEVAGASAARRTLEDIQTGKVETTNRQQLKGLLTQRAYDKTTEVLRGAMAKKRGQKQTDSLGNLVRRDEGGAREFEIPAEGHEQSFLAQALLKRLETKLPWECLAVLPLYLEGLTQSAIGEALGISPDAVGRRIKKIKEIGSQIVAGS